MELEKSLSELYQKDQDLTISLRTTPDLREKRKIEAERNVLRKKIQELESKIEEHREKQASETLESLLKQQKPFIFVNANGRKLEISERLEVELVFEPCKHRQTIKVMELLRNPQYPSNTNLLNHWQRMLKEDVTISTMLLCPQCRKEKESKLVVWGLKTEKPHGRANIVLRRLQ